MSDKLLDERPLIVLPSLAKQLNSVDKAIILQQIHWLAQLPHCGVVRDGHKWIYGTYESWAKEYFPFWTPGALRRHINQLEQAGWLFSAQFDMAEGKATKYYRVNHEMLKDPSVTFVRMGVQNAQMGVQNEQAPVTFVHPPRTKVTGHPYKSDTSIYRTETSTETSTKTSTKRGDLVQDQPASQPAPLPPPLTNPSAEATVLGQPAITAPTIASTPIQVSAPTPPVAAPLPAPIRPALGVLGAGTGDPLMDQATARFKGQWGGNREQHHLDELQRQVAAIGLTAEAFRQLVDACLEKYGMAAVAALSTDDGVRALTRAQTTMLAICAIDERFRSVAGLESIFVSWRENDYRGESLPNSTQLIEHAGKMKAGAVASEAKKGQVSHGSTNAVHRNGGGRLEQPAYSAGSAAPDFSRYNRNKASRQPSAGT